MGLARFWSELRRRRVVRVAIAYSAVAWLIIEVTSTIVPELGLPASLTRWVILAAFTGFPLALVLSWALDITPRGIEVTDGDEAASPHAAEASARHTRSSRAVFSAFILGVLLAAGALSVFQLTRNEALQLERAELRLAEVDRLTRNKRYAEAYEIAEQVEEVLEDPSRLKDLWPEIADRLTVTSDPPGATVTARPIPKDDASRLGEPVALGITPIEQLRIARNDWLLRVEKEGYASVERVASSALNRVEDGSSPEIAIDITMVPAADAPPEMVFVPGGEYEMVSPDIPPGQTVVLDDFFIDKYEVSNADFAEFAKGGSYKGDPHWSRPPPDMDRHPVSGISWHGASAYCTSLGKRLPTAFQWEKAARDGLITHFEGVVMPWGYLDPGDPRIGRANFGSEGTVPVDAQPAGISPYGAYAMAGNVKEWTANAVGDRYLVTGGSWEDPDYLFTEFGLYAPDASSRSLGFRCAMVRANDARRDRDQGSTAISLDDSTPVYEPVDEARFRTLLEYYRYDPRPSRAELIETTETDDWIREKISYVGPQNERVLAYLWLPKVSAPPFQTILFIPGANAFFGKSVHDIAERRMGPHVRSGRAVFAPVLKGMVEREWGPDFEMPATDSIRFRDLMVRHSTELRLGLDYLETRNDIDSDRIAYVGISLGAGSRLGWAAVDQRYSAVVFIGGGIDERMKPTLPEADNVNFAPYIKPPKLMVNGWQDDEHPWATRGLPLWNLLKEPKEKVIFEGAGHVPAENLRVPVIEEFLDRIMGSPR